MGFFGQILYPLLSLFFLCYFHIVLSHLPETQKTSMFQLSQLLNKTSIWDFSKDPNPCSWKGIECSSGNSSISKIDLSGSSLSSFNFVSLICKIDTLTALDFSHNFFTSIPEEFINDCGRIESLSLLDFSNNKLVGSLPSFVGFNGLEFLDLSFNNMSGSIGFQLNGLVSLKSLNLSSNSFVGSIPTNLGRDKALELIVFSKNLFQGTIPEAITSYVNLSFIDLSDNNLTGSLPLRIGDLSKLKVVILSTNNLNGEIPKSLSNMSTLVSFAAHQNKFHGKIPDGLTNHVKNLDLSYNSLSDSIPSDLLSQPSLQTVDLSSNRLVGSIPADLSSSLVRLRLGSNMLNGMIPETFGKLLNLKYLEMDNNDLTGLIPGDLGSCEKLMLLNVAQNNLSGRLPSGLGKLQALQVMELQSNNLFGEIPSEIMQLQELTVLNISSNSFNGSIPPSITFLNKLMKLDLRGNRLSGSIPDTIGNMSSLLELQLGSNLLTNPIPQMPSNLQIALNLSTNSFIGLIPRNFARLIKLEILDLSNNKFSGEIPAFLVSLESLTALILSNNQLSGVIPRFKDWVLVKTSGNPGLINVMSPTSDTSPAVVKKRKSTVVVIVIMAAAAAAFFSAALIIFVAILLSRRNYKVNGMQSRSTEDLPSTTVIQVKLLSPNSIHRSKINFVEAMEAVADPSNIKVKTRFSTYYKAVMPSRSSYYVKKLECSDKIFQLGSHDKFGRELEVLGKLNNSNIMTPLAYVLTIDSAYLFYEYVPKGTLFDVLHGSLGTVLDWSSRYSVAIGAAQGLAFLNGCASGPLLLDLSSKSIFLKSLKEPQIGDIELSKVIDPSKSTGSLSTVAGSVGYIPPEYAYTMRVSAAGNVYSFGVILLELLTGKTAVSEGTELAKTIVSYSKQHPKRHKILDKNISRTSADIRSQMIAVLDVAVSCVSPNPEARPKMNTVLRMLLNAR